VIYRDIWSNRTLPPTAPMVAWLPALPNPIGPLLFGVMLVALIALAAGRAQRAASIVLASVYFALCSFDQLRLQPHFLIGPMFLLVLGSRMTATQRLAALRLMLGGVYFFAGLNKLNVLYVNVVHPEMMQALASHLPSAFAPLFGLPWLAALGEMSVGIAVVVAPRRWALAGAIAMHVFIGSMLLSADHDLTVVPFNLGLALCAVVALLDRTTAKLTELARAPSGAIAIGYAVIVPVLALLGFADMYTGGHAYYSGAEARMRWYASEAAQQRLNALVDEDAVRPEGGALFKPARVPPGARPLPAGMKEIRIHPWYDVVLRQGAPGEARVAESIKRQLCALAATSPDDIVLRFYGNPNLWTGTRLYRDVNCDGTVGFWPKFAGLAPTVWGGTGEVYTLDQREDPEF
jgi:hypothetical protein